ncbi:MAG: lysozyme inhibitor LprI family protein [Pseudomonadota bacterium]
MRCAAIVLAAGLVPAMAQAQDCSGTTADMAACGSAEFQLADAELNAVYGRAMAAAERGGFAADLRAAQRLWIPYRDAACHVEAAPYAGGSIAPLIFVGCLTRLTEERTQGLRLIYEN